MPPDHLPPDEVTYDANSYVDPNGRVFEWRGQIYRAILPEAQSFFKELIANPFFKELQEKGFIIPTHLTTFKLPTSNFILQHEKVHFLSYCFEWCPQMLKDAALHTLELNSRLLEEGYTLQDAYPFNIQYKNTRPEFIDIGSIINIPENTLWHPYQQFCNFFLLPLHLQNAGNFQAAKIFLMNYINGIQEEEFLNLIPLKYKLKHPDILVRFSLPVFLNNIFNRNKLYKPPGYKFISSINLQAVRMRFISSLIKAIKKIKLPETKSYWCDYYNYDFNDFTPSSSWNLKQKNVLNILQRLKPKTILDIGCNTGWYSMLAARQGIQVVAFDSDPNCIAKLYLEAKTKNLSILPLVIDILNPTPSFGWKSTQFPSLQERMRNMDLVFFFAVLHHLVFKQRQNFDRILESIKAFNPKQVLIEFVSKEDEKSKILLTQTASDFSWYTQDNFEKSLENHFRIINKVTSFPPTSCLYLCKSEI